jgi:hypothetical protein
MGCADRIRQRNDRVEGVLLCFGTFSLLIAILSTSSLKKRRKIPRAVYDTNDFEFLLSRWAIEN